MDAATGCGIVEREVFGGEHRLEELLDRLLRVKPKYVVGDVRIIDELRQDDLVTARLGEQRTRDVTLLGIRQRAALRERRRTSRCH